MSAAFAVQSAIPEDSEARAAWFRSVCDGSAPAGYARPVGGPDERIAAGLQILADAGMPAGPALVRAFWLRDQLRVALGLEMHVSAFWAAVALDFGFDAREYDAFMLLMYTPGYAAVHGDQLARPALSFLPEQQTRVEG